MLAVWKYPCGYFYEVESQTKENTMNYTIDQVKKTVEGSYKKFKSYKEKVDQWWVPRVYL